MFDMSAANWRDVLPRLMGRWELAPSDKIYDYSSCIEHPESPQMIWHESLGQAVILNTN